MSQYVQLCAILPFLISNVLLPDTIPFLPVGGMVPPDGVRIGPVLAPQRLR